MIAANVDVAFIVQALDDGIAVYIQKVKMDFRNSTDYELSDEVAYNEEPGKIIGSVFEILKQANRFIRRTEGPTPLYR